MTSLKPSKRVRVNKIGILFFATIALTVGIAPATLAIGQVEAMIVLMISTLIGVARHLHGFESLATEKPSFLEYMIGSIGIPIWGVFTSFFLLISYLISRGGVYLIEFIANALGSGMQLPAHLIAYVISVIVAFLFNLLWANMGAETLAQQLFPDKSQRKSVFYELLTHRRRRLVGYLLFASLVLVGLVLVVWFATGSLAVWNIWWFNILFLGYLFLVSISPLSPREPVEFTLPPAIKAVRALFESLEYQVIVSPKTGKPEYDPFMAGLDFFVQNKENTFAVAVQTQNSLWVPSSFLHATVALEEFLKEEQKGIEKVIPVVFFIGKKGKKKTGNFKVIKITEAKMNRILYLKSQKDQMQLKKLAKYYLKKIDKNEARMY